MEADTCNAHRPVSLDITTMDYKGERQDRESCQFGAFVWEVQALK